jgi:hypothetical protein
MQLKTTADYVDEFTEYFGDLLSDYICCSGTTCNCGGESALPSAEKWLRTTLKQDRQDTITAVIEMVNTLTTMTISRPGVEVFGTYVKKSDLLEQLQALSPKD